MSDTILDDGYKVLFGFGTSTVDELEIVAVTPPAIEGGDPIDTTSFSNTAWRTFALRALKTLEEFEIRVKYSPALIGQIITALNVNQELTITFPDTDTLVFWGGVRRFAPGEFVEGEQPEGTLTIKPTLRNASRVETAPVYTNVGS